MKRNTVKMVALYKCRACGKTFRRGDPVYPWIAVRNTCAMSMMDTSLKDKRVRIRAPHYCGDDAVGLGDFIGYTANIDAYPKDE